MSGGDPKLIDSLILSRVPWKSIIVPVLWIMWQMLSYFVYELSLSQIIQNHTLHYRFNKWYRAALIREDGLWVNSRSTARTPWVYVDLNIAIIEKWWAYLSEPDVCRHDLFSFILEAKRNYIYKNVPFKTLSFISQSKESDSSYFQMFSTHHTDQLGQRNL